METRCETCHRMRNSKYPSCDEVNCVDILHNCECICPKHGGANTKTCKVAECMECAVIDCPYKEPLHYHHDGCPACETAETPERECPYCGRTHDERGCTLNRNE